ncbi:hypothetical protein HGRIS_003461 [Hohenbuehelia grisea]|uniref:DNA 3'-5' helicase n=1 Tax=Hohenbuehelia grisea TaxID=104357 RepID=A0ABR3JGG0_9AGAR
MISKAKAKGLSASELLAETRADALKQRGKENASSKSSPPNDVDHVVAEIYAAYERSLRKSNSLDFDDLLLFGVKLLSQHTLSVSWCRHVLVDEFQDTNAIQYELMKIIGRNADDCVTVVGDPDQSIYGWRSAEVANLAKMQKDFPATVNIILGENYRSTAGILKASLAIVSQDKARLPKSLHTSHPSGNVPSLLSFSSERDEAAFISVEIKRLVAHMGGVLNWGDFAILLRFNALSRTIESALQKEGIPNRILGGHKFFERLEIKDLLAYLQLVDNPQFVPAFARAINVPSRGIGEKTVAEIFVRADKTKSTPLEVIEKICDGRMPDIKPPVKRKVASFVAAIRSLRKLASEGSSPVDILRQLLTLIAYEDHLKQSQSDWESRWENVQELITFASEAVYDSPDDGEPFKTAERPEDEGSTPLRMFLQASMLSSEGDQQAESDNKDKVTIATCHAAKGLEWPVVLIPSVEQGTFPFYRCDDVEEERRLLYVACTRAQALLYLTSASKRLISGETKNTTLSTFVSTVTTEDPSLFDHKAPDLLPSDRAVVSRVLGRLEPQHNEVIRRVAEL